MKTIKALSLLKEKGLSNTGSRKRILEALMFSSGPLSAHEIYQRLLQEVSASHILISMPYDIIEIDTIKFYEKAINIREKLLRGEKFEAKPIGFLVTAPTIVLLELYTSSGNGIDT